jgi:prepilin-type N-terminal cleavage/methylation domain-containing protein
MSERPNRVRRSGFTLLELLIAMSIVAVLAGMLFSVMGVARRSSMRSSTEAVMRTVDTAIRLFKSDIRCLPFHSAPAEALEASTIDVVSAGTALDGSTTGRSNNLMYRLGTDIGTTARNNIETDLLAVDAAFYYNLGKASAPSNGLSESHTPLPATAFKTADTVYGPAVYNPDIKRWEVSRGASVQGLNSIGTAVQLNRMATEKYRLAILAGHAAVTGWKSRVIHYEYNTTSDPAPPVYVWQTCGGRDLSGSPLIAATSAAKPGWAQDYLDGQIEARFRSGEAILDAWKRPLVYYSPVLQGVLATNSWFNNDWQGSNWGLREDNYGLEPEGRPSRIQPLTRHHSNIAYAVPGDPATADRRFWAGPGFEFDFELWSAGPDGRFAWGRAEAMNKDNIGLYAYDRRLAP